MYLCYLQEYCDLYAEYLLNTMIEKQFSAFTRGFHMVTDESPLAALFSSQEVEELVCGSSQWDFKALVCYHTVYILLFCFIHPHRSFVSGFKDMFCLWANAILIGIFDLFSNFRVITSLCRYGQPKCKISFGISVYKIK